jgi:glycosyltransferase involved in cell wall biosynthesis
MTFKLSVIIPAFNEEAGIGLVLEALLDEPRLASAEILVIDDGSTDRTAECVSRFSRVRLIRHRVNKGYGSAIRSGTLAATGDLIAWYDSDGQHRVEDLLAVVGTVIERQLDYCIGIRGRGAHQVANRMIGKLILRMAVDFAAGQRVKDFNSGLRCFRREVLTRYLHLLPRGFGASTTTTILMIERGYSGGEVEIATLERVGKSSVRQMRDGSRTLMIILRLMLLFKPLQFFSTIGAVAILAGFAWNFSQVDRQGFSVIAATMILFGFQTVFYGLLADQISAMRREGFER